MPLPTLVTKKPIGPLGGELAQAASSAAAAAVTAMARVGRIGGSFSADGARITRRCAAPRLGTIPQSACAATAPGGAQAAGGAESRKLWRVNSLSATRFRLG